MVQEHVSIFIFVGLHLLCLLANENVLLQKIKNILFLKTLACRVLLKGSENNYSGLDAQFNQNNYHTSPNFGCFNKYIWDLRL